MTNESLLSFDPGAPFGWAYFEQDDNPRSHIPCAGVFSPWDVPGSDLHKWLARSTQAAREIEILVKRFSPRKVAFELPWFSAESTTSMAATGRGDILKLCMNIGRLMEVCRHNNIPIKPIRAIDWKGNLQDAHVIQRVHEWIPTGPDFLGEVITDRNKIHAYDAVGIGIFARTGRF